MNTYADNSLQSPERPNQNGFTLIEMAVVMVIVGIIISIIATVMPSLIRSAKIKQNRAYLEKIDYAIKGFVTANHRFPYADNGTSGVEDSGTPTYFGNIPFITLGLSSGNDVWGNRIKYGVNSDLTTTDSSTLGTALGTACPAAPDLNKLHIVRASDGSAVNMAYVIVSGGPKDLDLDGSFFDNLNSDGATDNSEYEDPDRMITATYDDMIMGSSCNEVSGSQGYGGGTGTGTGTGSTGVENTNALCNDGIDNDGDGKIDCHDQDCCSAGLSVCSGGCPPPDAVAIVTSPDHIYGTVGQTGYSHTFQATGGSGYYYWYLDSVSPSFSGLGMDLTSGLMSGDLNACNGDFSINVRVTDRYDSAKTDSHTFQLTINPGTISVSPAPTGLGDPPDFTVNSSTFSQDFVVSGDFVGPFTSTSPAAWSIQWLDTDPGGFQIDPVSDTGARLKKTSSTTARTNSYPFTITVKDDSCPSNSFTTGAYTIKITTAGAGAPYSANLVAEWDMDECSWDGTSGEVRDQGDLALDGTAMGGATTIGSGKNCRAGFFDGANDYVTVPDNAELQRTTAFTLALWVKVAANASKWVRLAGKGDSTNRNYGLWLATGGQVLFQIYSDSGGRGNAQTTVTVNDGNWHHLVGVYDLTTMKVYVDNVERASTNFNQNPLTSTDPFTMAFAGYATYLNGWLDEVMLFHKALSTTEIDEIFNITRSSCSGACYQGPVAEYRMENFPWKGTAGEVADSGSGSSTGVAAARGSGAIPAQTTPSGGKICRAGTFTRIDANNGGYLDMGDPADGDLDPGSSHWTIAGWINWDGTSTSENIIYNKENLYEARMASGRIQYAWQPHWAWDGAGSFPVTADTWTHMTIVYDGHQQAMYKDGQRVFSRAQTGAVGANSSKLLIGARGNTSPRNFWGGMIDELKIYNRALAENEINSLLTATRDCGADSVVITSTSLPAATVGQTGYTSGSDPVATGGTPPYVWQIVSQEGGLGLSMPDVSTGVVTGNINVCSGVYNITLRVTDSAGRMDETPLPLTVSNGTLVLTGLPATLDCDSTTCSWNFSVTGPILGQLQNWTINWQGASPGGFEVISTGAGTATFRKIGTSTAADGYRFTLTAEDSSCSDNKVASGTYTLNVTSSAQGVPYYAGLVAHYHFDECSWAGTSGEITDSSGSGLDGTAAGESTTGPGKECRAGVFDGIDDYADMGNVLNSPFGTSGSAFSILAWIKPESLGTHKTNHRTGNCFAAKASDSLNDNLEIGVTTNGKLHLYLDTQGRNSYADFGSPGDIALGKWNFTAITYDGNKVTAYINGTPYANATTWNGGGNLSDANGSPFTIGSSRHIDDYFHGKIDEVMVYDKALSSSEVADIRNLSHSCSGSCYPSSVTGSPIGLWHMDECTWDGTAGEILDSSGQGANGTSYNMGALDDPYRAQGRECRSAALNLNGTVNQYLELGTTGFTSLNDFALSMWFKVETLSSSVTPLFSGAAAGSGNNMLILINSTGNSITTYVNNTATGSFNLGSGVADGLWHHVVWTRQISDGAETIFLDSTQINDGNTAADTAIVTLDSGGAVIGQEQDSVGGGFDPNQVFHGWIDELRLYNKVLSQTDVDALYDYRHDCDGNCYSPAIALYRMETDFSDIIGGYNGTASGHAVVDASGGCNSGSFTSNDSGVSISGLPVSTTAGEKTTVTFWMYWAGNNSEMPIGWDSYDLYFLSNQFGFNTGCGDLFGVDLSASLAAMTNNWHHVAAVFTNGDVTKNQLYIDGVLQPLATLAGTHCVKNVSSAFSISGWPTTTGYKYDGRLDEIKIYTRALSAAEAADDMASGHSCK